jgi:hypothetical protein
MKKVFAILAVAGVFAACNSASESTATADSLKADSLKKDSLAKAAVAAPDTTHKADTTTPKM